MTPVMVRLVRRGNTRDVNQTAAELRAPRTQSPAVRLRPIALPSEHGGWGMVTAPVLAGLILAPSWPGLFLASAGFGAFLTRQPFRLALTDLRKGKRYPRTAWATRFAALYAILGVISLFLAASVSRAPFWIPLGMCALLGSLQFAFDINGQGRRFVPEASGAIAMAMLGVAVARAGGAAETRAWLAGLVLAMQFATAIPYAAARVRLARGVPVRTIWSIAGHLAAVAVAATLAVSGLARWPIAGLFAILAARAAWGLSPFRREVRAATVGIQEVGYAALTVAAIGLCI